MHLVPIMLLLLIVDVYVVTVRFPQQQFVKIQFYQRKGKPLKQIFVWEVPFSQLWKVLPEYVEQFSMRGVPIQMDRTARTCWICFSRIFLHFSLNLNRTQIFYKCYFEIHSDGRQKSEGWQLRFLCWIWKEHFLLQY